MNRHTQLPRKSASSSDTMLDSYDRLLAACQKPEIWPANSIRTQSFRHTLRSYQERLFAESTRLFDSNPSNALIEVLEPSDGQFQSTQCKSLRELRDHFQVNRKEPKCRYIFFSARHSRAPIRCSKEMFGLVMTFHQAMSPFVELVLGFGKPRSEQEFHYTAFRHEGYMGTHQGQRLAIPQLGRSGREIRHCFNLWSPEQSNASGSMTWSLRQTAAYHAFDIEFGQSLWINIKANNLVKARIVDAAASCEALQAQSLSSLCGSFAAALATHLILFEWCTENWRWYNSSLEESLRNILDKVNNAPVEKVEGILRYDAKTLVQTLRETGQPTSPKPTTTRQSSFSSWAPTNPVRKVSRAFTGLTSTTTQSTRKPSLSVSIPMSPLLGPTQESPAGLDDATHNEFENQDPFEVLRDFSISKLQYLNGIGSDLHRSRLVMKLNVEIMNDLLGYYGNLWDDSEFPREIKDGCKSSFLEFSRRTKSFVRTLEMEVDRIAALMLLLNDGKELFDKFLQLRHIEQSKLFTANAHQSAQHMQNLTVEMHNSTKNMEIIAAKTEKETASMHIITLVTLVFLPGTFVAVRLGLPLMPLMCKLLTTDQTLFGSGLYQWDQNNPVTSVPIWKEEFWKLFSKVSFPLMVGTIVIWLVFAYFIPGLKGYLRRQRVTDEEEGNGNNSEENQKK
ncbi:hypothetical protein QBC44DRAFT_154128 [Cladorrhinum sp. PSN332]|nr:hypothetical protein QBC44DRAFT_154128 [Cladorrhinum sp. PSN332]